jgi:hypothetical protein
MLDGNEIKSSLFISFSMPLIKFLIETLDAVRSNVSGISAIIRWQRPSISADIELNLWKEFVY